MEYLCTVCEEEIWYHEPIGQWYLRVVEGAWDNDIDDFAFQDIAINFCYKCGKDYRKVKP